MQYAVMSPARYVCLSDLHLGAENSLLSNVAAGETSVDLGAPSPVLVELVECLASLLGRLADRLAAAAHRRKGLRHVKFELRYPTYAVESHTPGAGTRVVAFHHGHYTEASSASISALRRAAFPRETASPSAWDRHDESSPWVE